MRAIIISSIIISTLLALSCSDSKMDIAKETPKRELLPTMTASNVNTIISDSGVARFRIVTPEWFVFDKVKNPYWEFKKGIHFERFDQKQNIDAYMDANRAKFDQKTSVWEFNGNVEMKNLKGEIFKTEQLFWDEANGRFYSDLEISIKKQGTTIRGIGFESNSSLTRYIIRKPIATIMR